MINNDRSLTNIILVKNIILQHFSSVSEQDSLVFDDISVDESSKSVNIGFSFCSKTTGKKHYISDYRIPISIIINTKVDNALNSDYFVKFNRFVSDDAASYLEHINNERLSSVATEAIIFAKKAWPHILFLGSLLYIFSI